MNFLDISLVFSALLCTLVTGFILLYALVVMPGFARLNDREFIRAFQVTDGIIQANQPFFLMIWIGSIVSVIFVMISSILMLEQTVAHLIVCVCVVYLLGVQGITMVIHLPLNNRIRKLDIKKLDDQIVAETRLNFEKKWNRFNNIRTFVGFLVSLAFIIVVMIR